MDSLLTRFANQTAVYWGSPVDDGYGGKTYADPVNCCIDDADIFGVRITHLPTSKCDLI